MKEVLQKDLTSKRLMTFGAMGFLFSKSLGQVVENKLLMVRLNIPWGCIIWLIEPTLWFRLYYICNGEQNWMFVSNLVWSFFQKPQKAFEIYETNKAYGNKGGKDFENVKTHQTSMLSLTHVMVEYKTLLMKMALDDPTNEKVKVNFDLFCDVQILLWLVAIHPLL